MHPVHKIPANDQKEHIGSIACDCRPIIEYQGVLVAGDNDLVEGMLVIHNSYDGRELTEPDNVCMN